MPDEIIELKSVKKGPTSIVLVGVHGNEVCGIEALKNILPKLKVTKGRVLFGYGNPKAIKANKRFLEANLNRMFKENKLLSKNDKESYEYSRAQFLKKYLKQADALLDIHASFTPNSRSFAICEPKARRIARYLPVNLVVSGFNKLEAGGTDYYMSSIGKIGICVECGYLGDAKSVKVAEKSILAFLGARGNIMKKSSPKKQSYTQMNDLYTTKTNNFVLTKLFDDFEKVSKGQIIGIDGKEKVVAKKDGIILFARNRKQVGDEAFLFGQHKKSIKRWIFFIKTWFWSN